MFPVSARTLAGPLLALGLALGGPAVTPAAADPSSPMNYGGGGQTQHSAAPHYVRHSSYHRTYYRVARHRYGPGPYYAPGPGCVPLFGFMSGDFCN